MKIMSIFISAKSYFHCGLGVACLSLLSSFSYAQESGGEKENRIDFGNAYIQGQSIKSGAVYLTNRRKSTLKSLLKTRESYRYEIVKDFYGGEVKLENLVKVENEELNSEELMGNEK